MARTRQSGAKAKCLAWLLFIGLGSAGANAAPTANDLLAALQNATAPAQCSAVQEEIEFSRTGLKTAGPANNHVRMIGYRYWDHQRIAYKLESWSLVEDHLAASSPSNLIRMIARRDDVFTYTHFSGKRTRNLSMTSDKAGVESNRSLLEGEEDFGSFLDGYLADVNGTITLVGLARRGHTRVLPEQQTIGNAPCWVVESQGEFGTLHIWVAPGEDFNAVKFTLEEGESPVFKDESGAPFKSGGKRFDQAATTVVNGRKLISAGRLVNTATRRDGTAVIETVQVKRVNVALAPNFELLHAFELDDVPSGTLVHISGAVASPIQYVWQDGRAVWRWTCEWGKTAPFPFSWLGDR